MFFFQGAEEPWRRLPQSILKYFDRYLIRRLARPKLGGLADPIPSDADLVLSSAVRVPCAGNPLRLAGHHLLCPVGCAREAREAATGL